MTFIKKHINLTYDFDGALQRKERWQYPLEALRELLLNCVVHRDYKNLSDIIIKIFDDKIVFTNPGILYGKLKLQDIECDDYVSSLRNRLLAEAFYLTGDIERYGTGFVRIREFLKAYPEVIFTVSEQGDFFRAELRIISPQKTPPKESLGTKIIELLVSNPELSQREISEILDIGFDTVREYFAKLKKDGKIKRIGGRRNGFWEIL